MDPQRQYARLLTLWSEGSKVLRRDQYLLGKNGAGWDIWWKMGRRIVERGLLVLPLPLATPALLIGDGDHWWNLVDDTAPAPPVFKGVVMMVEVGASLALSRRQHWWLSDALVMRLGARGFSTLCRWDAAAGLGGLAIEGVDVALEVLGAVDRRPKLFRSLAVADWPLAARMLRHPHTPVSSDHGLPPQWGFRFDVEAQSGWFERQDEDSVHKR